MKKIVKLAIMVAGFVSVVYSAHAALYFLPDYSYKGRNPDINKRPLCPSNMVMKNDFINEGCFSQDVEAVSEACTDYRGVYYPACPKCPKEATTERYLQSNEVYIKNNHMNVETQSLKYGKICPILSCKSDWPEDISPCTEYKNNPHVREIVSCSSFHLPSPRPLVRNDSRYIVMRCKPGYKVNNNIHTNGVVCGSCEACPVGTFSDGVAKNCTLCAEGTYTNLQNSAQCKVCPAGTEIIAGKKGATRIDEACRCATGMVWNSNYTECVKVEPKPCTDYPLLSEPKGGAASKEECTDGGKFYRCSQGYRYDDDVNACTKTPKCELGKSIPYGTYNAVENTFSSCMTNVYQNTAGKYRLGQDLAMDEVYSLANTVKYPSFVDESKHYQFDNLRFTPEPFKQFVNAGNFMYLAGAKYMPVNYLEGIVDLSTETKPLHMRGAFITKGMVSPQNIRTKLHMTTLKTPKASSINMSGKIGKSRNLIAAMDIEAEVAIYLSNTTLDDVQIKAPEVHLSGNIVLSKVKIDADKVYIGANTMIKVRYFSGWNGEYELDNVASPSMIGSAGRLVAFYSENTVSPNTNYYPLIVETYNNGVGKELPVSLDIVGYNMESFPLFSTAVILVDGNKSKTINNLGSGYSRIMVYDAIGASKSPLYVFADITGKSSKKIQYMSNQEVLNKLPNAVRAEGGIIGEVNNTIRRGSVSRKTSLMSNPERYVMFDPVPKQEPNVKVGIDRCMYSFDGAAGNEKTEFACAGEYGLNITYKHFCAEIPADLTTSYKYQTCSEKQKLGTGAMKGGFSIELLDYKTNLDGTANTQGKKCLVCIESFDKQAEKNTCYYWGYLPRSAGNPGCLAVAESDVDNYDPNAPKKDCVYCR